MLNAKITLTTEQTAMIEILESMVESCRNENSKIEDGVHLKYAGTFTLTYLKVKMVNSHKIEAYHELIDIIKDGALDREELAGQYMEQYLKASLRVASEKNENARFEGEVNLEVKKALFHLFRSYLSDDLKAAIKLLGLRFSL